MKKCIWLLIFAMVCGYVGGCRAAAVQYGDPIREPKDFFDEIEKKCFQEHENYFCGTGDSISWHTNSGPTDSHCANTAASYIYTCIFAGGWVGVSSCTSCDPGFDLKSTGLRPNYSVCARADDCMEIGGCTENKSLPGEGGSGVGGALHNVCVQNCQDSNCKSDASWVKASDNPAYESKSTLSCSEYGANGTCNTNTIYRCAFGYHGSSTDGKTGCTRCPAGTVPEYNKTDDINTCINCPAGEYGVVQNGTNKCVPCPKWTDVYAKEALTQSISGQSVSGAKSITECFVPQGTYYDSTGTFETDGKCYGKPN